MAGITTTEAAEVIPTIVAAETLGALSSNLVLASIVNRDYENEVADYGDTINIGIRGAVTAVDKAAGTDLTPQNPTHTKAQVVLDKHKAVPIQADDIAIMFSRPSLIPGYAEDAALVIAEQIEADIATLYSGFSQTIDATSGLGEDDFREAQRLLNAAKAPQANRWAVLHEDAYSEASNITRLINSDYQGPSAVQANQLGVLGFLNGFNVVLSQNIQVATSQPKNLFMQRNAITLVTRPMRVTQNQRVMQAVMVENGIAVRVTMDYNTLGLAELMVIDVVYGLAELRDNHGITVSTTEI